MSGYAVRKDGLGWRACDGEEDVMAHEEYSETEPNITVPPQVPQRVTMRQARLALLGAGLLPQVEGAINALPEPPQTAARIEWDFSSEVFRDREFVNMLGAGLGLTSTQIDQLFITAASL